MKKYIFIILTVTSLLLCILLFTSYIKCSNLDSTLSFDNLSVKNAVSSKIELKKSLNYVSKPVADTYIPILMYHSISDSNPSNTLLVPPSEFENEIAWLHDNGFTSLSLDELYYSLTTGNVPEKPVVITFDDGYDDNYNSAYPILKKYGFIGNFFVITDYMDTKPGFMTVDMLKEMHSNGMVIESHTSNHQELKNLSDEDKKTSIKNAQDFLKEKLNIDSKFLCYPVGRYDEATKNVASSLGVKLAVTTEPGLANMNQGLTSLKRVRISPMSLDAFKSNFKSFTN